MAFLTLSTLLTTTPRDDALENLIEILQSVGFNATSWQDGSFQLSFLEMMATVWSNVTELTAAIAAFAYLATSEGDALTALADSQYDNQRFLATRTIGEHEFTTIAGAGPYTIVVGQLVSQSNSGVTYRNTTGGTFAPSSTVSLVMQAETAGTDGNVANGTIVTLNTPLAGVSVNNPAIGVTSTWTTSLAIDTETDPNLRVRCTTKWATLTITRPEDAYDNIVRNSDPAITRSTVITSLSVPGRVDIYIAGAEGTVGASAVTAAQDAVDAQRPITAIPVVALPVDTPFTPDATVYITAALDTPEERAAIEQTLLDYINIQPIGGTDFGGGFMIPFSILSQTVTARASVVNIDWVTPSSDILLATTELSTVNFAGAVGTNLTYSVVS